MTFKENTDLQQTTNSWGSYKELCWPSQPWHPWNLASGTLADGGAGTRGTPRSQLQHWNLQQGRVQSARKGGKYKLTDHYSWMLRDGTRERALADENLPTAYLVCHHFKLSSQSELQTHTFLGHCRFTPLESPLWAAHQGRQRAGDEMHSPASLRQRWAAIPCWCCFQLIFGIS